MEVIVRLIPIIKGRSRSGTNHNLHADRENRITLKLQTLTSNAYCPDCYRFIRAIH
jgi:hypothetical protein